MARTEMEAARDPASLAAVGAVTAAQASIEGFDLSPQQRRVWGLARHGGEAYRSWCAVRIDGLLRRAELAAALDRIAERHEILRTTFRSLPGLPFGVQVIARDAAPQLAGRDLERCPARDRSRLLAQLADRVRTVPFDLESGPLLRAWLVNLAPARGLLYLACPALLLDAAGLHNLVRELAEELGGRPGVNDAAPVQYADAAAAFNELLGSEGATKGRRFWRRNAPPDPSGGWLACEEPGPAAGPFLLRAVGRELAPAAAARVLGSSPGPADLLLACWTVLLGRQGGRTDLTLGVGAEGRAFEGLDRALGLYERRLPVRCTVDAASSFAELAAALAARRAAGEPWAEFFSWEDGEAFLPHAFAYHELPAALSAGALELSVEESRACIDRVRLELACQRHPGGLRVDLWFDPHHLGGVAAHRLLNQYLALVEAASEAPGRRLREVTALAPAARHQLLTEWNDTAGAAPQGRLDRLVAGQAVRTPEAVAIVREEDHRSFAALSATAAALARTLGEAGTGPGVVVGLWAERSPGTLAGMLGILAAGGAYLPLDPALPDERRGFMLEDAAVRLVLGGRDLPRERLGGYPGGIFAMAATPAEGGAGLETVDAGVSPGDPAYVIYTSGSTGRPKGVVVPHGAIVNRLAWMQCRFPVGGGDRLLQRTPLGFDASIWEIFVPLMSGATLVLADGARHQDAHRLIALAARERVTVMQLVPSLLQVLLGGGELEGLTGLRRLFCGGEALAAEVAERFTRRRQVELCNLYGPTEVAIDASFWPCRLGVGTGGVVPIGRPLDNVQVYVVDAGLRPQPMALPGELVVGGAGVASRYLRRPRWTAERFVPDGFGPAAGRRLYRTGDLARWRADGVLEFLGRRDDQVKVRGFRIELGEVEATLARHPVVRQAAVAVRETAAGDLRLVAYVVPQSGSEGGEEVWRGFLEERLPDYMVPSVFVLLDGFPRSSSGKVDRLALPAPPEISGTPYRPPRTATQEVLAACFAELLGLERVGLEEDFFASGGHSLLGTQLVARVREVFGIGLSLRALFESPTVEALAGRIDAARLAEEGLSLPPLEPLPRGGTLPLSFAQARLWFLDQIRPGTASFNLPAALQLAGRLDLSALERSLDRVIQRHETLRTTFTERDGQPRVLVDAGRPFRFCLVDLSALPEREREEAVRDLVERDVARPFDLARGPLLHGVLFRLAPESHAVTFTMHHIVGDAWSTSILVQEVSALYAAFSRGLPAVLPELPIQYADFAHWQQRWLAGETLERLVAYWRRRLAAPPRPASLPREREPLPVPTGRGTRRRVQVPDELARRLQALARSEGCTLFMVLLAVYQVLLAHYTGQDDVVVGTDTANRGRSEAEHLIGFFVNQMVLRTDLAGDPSFREVLARVREATLEAYDHQDLPFEKLVEVLNPSRDQAAPPLFQTKLVLQNVERVQLELGGLELSAFDFQAGTAQMDCIVNLEETAGALFGGIDYRVDVYDEETIDHYWSQYLRLAAGAVDHPEEKLSRLLASLREADREHREARRRSRAESRRAVLRTAARKAVRRG